MLRRSILVLIAFALVLAASIASGGNRDLVYAHDRFHQLFDRTFPVDRRGFFLHRTHRALGFRHPIAISVIETGRNPELERILDARIQRIGERLELERAAEAESPRSLPLD